MSGDQTYRVLAQRDGDVTLITAFLLDDVRATISRLVVVEVLGFIVIFAALGLVAWWVVHLGIRPVKEMTETATRIADGDLAVRVPETAPGTESGALAVALNHRRPRRHGHRGERTGRGDHGPPRPHRRHSLARPGPGGAGRWMHGHIWPHQWRRAVGRRLWFEPMGVPTEVRVVTICRRA